MSQNTTQYGTIEQLYPDISKQQKNTLKLKIPANWDQERVCWNYQSRGNPETG